MPAHCSTNFLQVIELPMKTRAPKVAMLSMVWLMATAVVACSTSASPSTPIAALDVQERSRTFSTKDAAAIEDMRAMWLWSETPSASDILENRGGAQDKLIEFVHAPHGHESHAINRLYFEAREHSNRDRMSTLRQVTYDPLVGQDKRPDLRGFLRRAHAEGTQVEYLDGQAIWLASDENARAPKRVCRDVVAFNLSTDDRRERFDGVHLDIEPHTVSRGPHQGKWFEDRLPNGYNRRWTARWQEILVSCRTTLDAYEQQTGHHLTLAADLGADFAYYNEPMREFFDRADAPTDYVAIMNYFDNRPNRDDQPSFFHGAFDGNAVVGGVEQNLALWRKTPVVFGAETGPAKIAPDLISFHQEGRSRLYQTLDELDELLDERGSTNCIGAAIHHYAPDAYRDLKP
jgi:hypothetical protein